MIKGNQNKLDLMSVLNEGWQGLQVKLKYYQGSCSAQQNIL